MPKIKIMLTNQEKIELKIQAMKLAKDLDEAKSIYAFLVDGLDDDPFRLDVPAPDCNEKMERLAKEIDWSRPQMVIGIGEYYGVKLKTNGESDAHNFTGRRLTSGAVDSNMWPKKSFVYYGEIPQEQPTEQKTTGLNFLEAMMMLNDENAARREVWPQDNYVYFRKRDVLRNEAGDAHVIHSVNILATDWQIVE